MLDLGDRAKEAEGRYREAWDKHAQFEHVVNALEADRGKQEWFQKNAEKLVKDLKQRKESDEWLQAEVDQYADRMDSHERQKKQQMEQFQELKDSIDELREDLRKKHIEAGKYEEQKTSHARQVEKRKTMVRETSHHHQIRGYDVDLDDVQINEYVKKISKLSHDQNAAVEKARRETESEMQKLRDTLSKLGQRQSVLNEGKNSAKRQSVANDRKIGDYQSELNKIETDEGGKEILEADIAELEEKLEKAKEDSRKASWDTKLQQNNTQLRGLEEESEQLDRDIVQGTRQAGQLAELEHLKKQVADRQRNLDKMKGVHNDRLKAIVGPHWQPSTLEVEFQRVIDKKIHSVKDAEHQRDAVSRALEQVDFKLGSIQADLKKGEKEVAACVRRVREDSEGEPEDYPQVLSDLQKDRDILKADVDNYYNERKYFEKGITVAEESHKCRLCLRAFQGEEEGDFTLRLREKLKKGAVDSMKKELNEIEDDLRKVKDAGSSYDTWLRLSQTVLPGLQAEMKRLGADRATILQEIEERDSVVSEREQAKREAESLTKPVASIVRNDQELTGFSDQKRNFTTKQTDAGLSSSLEDIQEQLKAVREKSRGVRNSIAKLSADKERALSLISSLELELSKAKHNLSTTNHQLDKRSEILKQIQNLKIDNQAQKDSARQAEVQLQELDPKIEEADNRIQDVKARGKERESDLQKQAVKLKNSVDRLQSLEQDIQSYIDDGGPAKLVKCQREIERVQGEIQEVEEGQKQVTKSINKISEELKNHNETKRTMMDNLNHRESLREIGILKARIASLSAQNAEADRTYWNKEASDWKRKYDNLSAQSHSKSGLAKGKDDQLVALLDEWNTDYKDAALRFKKAHIEVEVKSIALTAR